MWADTDPAVRLAALAATTLAVMFAEGVFVHEWSTSQLKRELTKVQRQLQGEPQALKGFEATIASLERDKSRLIAENEEFTEKTRTLEASLRAAETELAKKAFDASVSRATPAASTDTAPSTGTPSGFPPMLGNSIGMQLKLVPAGTFTMGDASGSADEKPPHQVTISKPFYVGVHEVTNAEWKQVMNSVPSPSGDGALPVVNVSWNDVQQFCRKLTELSAKHAGGRVYRLPTEAEWEYACRAGTKTHFSFGDGPAQLDAHGWYTANAGGLPHIIGQRRPNAYGLYDMHGNVWEWVNDGYESEYYAKSPHLDPPGPQSTIRVVRGGAWSGSAGSCRSGYRNSREPTYRHFDLGFRVAVTATDVGPSETPPEAQLPRTPDVQSGVAPDPGWLTQYRNSVGTTLSFSVTGSPSPSPVWGSNPYTADSSLARAAVHAGVLKPGQSGVVRVTILPGQQSYAGSQRNGVISSGYGPWGLSYRIEEAVDLSPASWNQTGNPLTGPQPDPGTLRNHRDSLGKTLSFAVVGTTNGGTVWGSNPYTADSPLARAAVHAGLLKPGQPGVVRVTILPGRQSYAGTARNGVTTSTWGPYPLSFRIEPK